MSNGGDVPTASETTYHGGCQCGRTRYRVTSKPVDPVLCQCRMCQKAVGAPMLTYAAVPTADFEWTQGRPKSFQSSSVAVREFCPECGTQLTFRLIGIDNVIDIMLMTLDRWNEIAPQKQVGIESRPWWLSHLANIPAQTTVESHGKERMSRIVSFQHPDYETDTAESALNVGGRAKIPL